MTAMKGKARIDSHLKLHKIMVVPAAVFGGETRSVKKNRETRIQIETKFFREAAYRLPTHYRDQEEITGF
jgi:hypothetical protein